MNRENFGNREKVLNTSKALPLNQMSPGGFWQGLQVLQCDFTEALVLNIGCTLLVKSICAFVTYEPQIQLPPRSETAVCYELHFSFPCIQDFLQLWDTMINCRKRKQYFPIISQHVSLFLDSII